MTAPGSLRTLRARHRSLVLDEVHRRGAASRAEISRRTGLSRTTVSSLVAELIATDLLVELDDRRPATGSGRPGTLLSVRPGGGALLGVHFAHDGVRVALTDLTGRVRITRNTPLDLDHRPQDALDYAAATARELIAAAPGQALGIGVALSGPTRRGRPVTSSGLLTAWAGIDVAGHLHAATGLPVVVGNDANMGALAEWRHGSGRGTSHLIYVMISEGVGAGLVIDGELREGASGVAGELGHVVVAPGGVVCRCGGRGCLETVAGTSAIVAALTPARGAGITLDDVLRWAADGDAGALRVVADAGRAVGSALAAVCAVLDVELVVVGGQASAAGAPLLDAIRTTLDLGLPPAIGGAVPVVAAELGSDAEVIGAAAAAGRSTALQALQTAVGAAAVL